MNHLTNLLRPSRIDRYHRINEPLPRLVVVSERNQFGLFLVGPLEQAAETLTGLAEIAVVLPRIISVAK
jgi:hypothetical protein